ncbi:Crp/Fnr family transcriptional regulator [Chitinophaga sedimenti]|uniref:Crp/Fnr family transcriptional regulator n=1 Tax=Chitinophaga sedimenti TaxID=2033606 RepID=UPI002002DC45|nr:Crp/Fnr family transcriptional regulator [Chitinophaga sedimenti]MCK7555923.1 Crp/Fnr family transcriptional regulator [Chitinophaga sedimenti]
MLEHFIAYMRESGGFNEQDLKNIAEQSTPRKMRRRQLLLQEGEVCRYKIFVVKGLLRTYRLKDDGSEYIMKFAPENSWLTDPDSFHRQTPSLFYIDALEEAEVVLWTKDNFVHLCTTIPALKAYSDKVINRSTSESQQRILMNISYTSEEKYEAFMAAYPDILRRVPLHMVASYLGVSRETLSRIRHARMRQ